jgi:hypothetical protein
MFQDQFDGDTIKMLRQGTKVLTRANGFSLGVSASIFKCRKSDKLERDDFFNLDYQDLSEDEFDAALERS